MTTYVVVHLPTAYQIKNKTFSSKREGDHWISSQKFAYINSIGVTYWPKEPSSPMVTKIIEFLICQNDGNYEIQSCELEIVNTKWLTSE